MKLLEVYYYKSEELWLSSNWDDISNESIDNSPKLKFIVAVDWHTGNQRPRNNRFRSEPELNKDYYSYFHLKFYLGYYQFVGILRLKKLPYRNTIEWRQWRIDEI